MVYLTRKIEFSASHLYHNPAFSAEENRRVFGKCNNPHGHGHNYVLEVTDRMDHRFLNYEVPELAGQIPTCENIAAVIWRLLEPRITRGRLNRVRLYETPDLFVDCYGEENGSGNGMSAGSRAPSKGAQ